VFTGTINVCRPGERNDDSGYATLGLFTQFFKIVR
jgi:hypothetical protein